MSVIRSFPWRYLVIAYGWAWLIWIPVAFTRTDYQSSPLLVALLLLGVFGPGIAGLLMTYADPNRGTRRDFWQRLFDLRRIRWQWIALMLVLWPALHIAANGIARVAGQPVPSSGLLAQVEAQPAYLLVVVVLYFVQAALEDLGWRGYMGERLLRTHSPARAGVLVGIFHAFWHLPLFFIAGTNQTKMGFGLDFWLFVAQALAFSVLATWCYVDNAHSTMAAILLHTVGNLCNDIFVMTGGPIKLQIYTVLMVLAAITVQLWMSRRARSSAMPSLQQI